MARKPLTDLVTIEELRYRNTPEFKGEFNAAYNLIENVGPQFTEEKKFFHDRMEAVATPQRARDEDQSELIPQGYDCKVYIARDHRDRIVAVSYGSRIALGDGKFTTFMGYHARKGKPNIELEARLVRALQRGLDPDNKAAFRVFEIERGNKDDIPLAGIAMKEYGAFPLDIDYRQPAIDAELKEESKKKEQPLDLYVAGPRKLTNRQVANKNYSAENVAALIKTIHGTRGEYLAIKGQPDYNATIATVTSIRDRSRVGYDLGRTAWLKVA